MQKYLMLLSVIVHLSFQLFAQQEINNDYDCGYINADGDTIIRIGKYAICYTDTIKEFGIVLKDYSGFIAINSKDSFLCNVFAFDNGPDIISDGFFRITDENGNIGYADSEGNIAINHQYKCAYPFIDNKAKVSYHCISIKDGEYKSWDSDNWFYINKKGSIIQDNN